MRHKRVGLTVDAALFMANYDPNIAAGLLKYDDLVKAAEVWRRFHDREEEDCHSAPRSQPAHVLRGRNRVRRLRCLKHTTC